MDLLPSKPLISDAARRGYAVPAFCVWDASIVDTVLRVAERRDAPVILMHGPGECGLLSPAQMAAVVGAMTARYDVPAALHLDHAAEAEHVDRCLAAGFTSVMLDLSDRPFDENAAALRQVVCKAHELGVTVEGEVGHVGKADPHAREGGAQSRLTEPDQARDFVALTQVDMLAVSIGNAHGRYPGRPRLEFDLLARLRDAANLPLVLHGGSGIPPPDLKRAISLGIAKVNVATELVQSLASSLEQHFEPGRGGWLPAVMGEAKTSLARVVDKWIHLTGAGGKAGELKSALQDRRRRKPR